MSAVEGDHLDRYFDQPVEIRPEYPDILNAMVVEAPDNSAGKVLKLKLDTSLGDLQGSNIPPRPKDPFLVIRLPDDFDLSRYTAIHCRARVTGGLNVYFKMGFIDGGGSWTPGPIHIPGVGGPAYNVPLIRGDWQQVTIPVGHHHDSHLKQCKWLVFKAVHCGHRPDDPPITEVVFDQFVGSKQSLRHHEGWAIDPTVIAVPQVGFKPLHEKKALVNADNLAPTFRVIDTTTQDVVFQGDLETVDSRIGRTKVADFSALIEPGRYIVQAGDVRSLAFDIHDDVWDTATAPLSDWIYSRRVGVATSASPEPYHLDDAVYVHYEPDQSGRMVEISRHRVDATGGWYDAGDVRGFFHYAKEMPASAIWSAKTGYDRDRNGDGVDDLTDKAMFAIDHLIRIQNPVTGELLSGISHQSATRRLGLKGSAPKAAGDYFTDNIPDTDDDRHVWTHSWVAVQMNRAAVSVGMFAQQYGDEYPELTSQALDLIESRWDYWFADDAKNLRERYRHFADWSKAPRGHMARNWGFIGNGALQLYLATGKQKYLDMARTAADMLIKAQPQQFYSNEQVVGDIFTGSGLNDQNRYAPQLFLAEMMLALPDDPNYEQWRATLIRSSEWLMKPTRQWWAPFSPQHVEVPADKFKNNDFGVLVEQSKRGKARMYISPWTHLTEYPIYAMRRVAEALDDPSLEQLARDQVRWTVGYNPFNVSWIHGVGEDYVSQYYTFAMPPSVGEYGGSTGMGKYTGQPRGRYGVPGVVRPEGPEPWVKPAERYLRAAISVSEPAVVNLNVHRGDQPHTGPVEVVWTRTGQTVLDTRTNAHGQVELELGGGQTYQLKIDHITLPLHTISGTQRDMHIDLDRLVLAKATAPDNVRPGQPFNIAIHLRSLGTEAKQIPLKLYLEGASFSRNHQTVMIEPGETATVEWPVKASGGQRPYIAVIRAEGTMPRWLDVTGAIR